MPTCSATHEASRVRRDERCELSAGCIRAGADWAEATARVWACLDLSRASWAAHRGSAEHVQMQHELDEAAAAAAAEAHAASVEYSARWAGASVCDL